MNETISVIIPVYNVEQYLQTSLDSVLNQDYSDLEIILIDDGSTDRSGLICDEYAKKDSRIHVIHQENKGAAAAKNAGLRMASGKYLAFADSDDFVEPGAYSHMLALMKKYNAQAVQCAFRDVFRTYTNDRIFKPGENVWPVSEYMRGFPYDWTCSLLWDKLYERNLFDGIFFVEGNKIDDEFFTYRGLMRAETIVTDDRIVYNYRKRASSVMQSPDSAKRIVRDRIVAAAERRREVIKAFPEVQIVYDHHFAELMLILSKDPSLTEETFELMKKEIRAYLKEKKRFSIPRGILLPLGALLLKKWKQPSAATADIDDADKYFE